jgi:hypothetical protein
LYTVTVLWLPYILVTVCTDIVTVRIGIVHSNCTVATIHIGNSVFSIRYAVGNSRKTEALSTCLFKHYAMKAYMGSNRELHIFLTSALHQLHVPTVLSRNKNHQQPISRRLLASQQIWTVERRCYCLSAATPYGTSDSCEYPIPISQDLTRNCQHLTANSQYLTHNSQYQPLLPTSDS